MAVLQLDGANTRPATPILFLTAINGTVIDSTFLALLHDRNGNTIGLIDIGLKFTTGVEPEAAKFARSVGQELAGEISTETTLDCLQQSRSLPQRSAAGFFPAAKPGPLAP